MTQDQYDFLKRLKEFLTNGNVTINEFYEDEWRWEFFHSSPHNYWSIDLKEVEEFLKEKNKTSLS